MKKIKDILKKFRQRWYSLAKKGMAEGEVFVDESGYTDFVENELYQAIRDYEEAVRPRKRKCISEYDEADEHSNYLTAGYNSAISEREQKIKQFWEGDLEK